MPKSELKYAAALLAKGASVVVNHTVATLLQESAGSYKGRHRAPPTDVSKEMKAAIIALYDEHRNMTVEVAGGIVHEFCFSEDTQVKIKSAIPGISQKIAETPAGAREKMHDLGRVLLEKTGAFVSESEAKLLPETVVLATNVLAAFSKAASEIEKTADKAVIAEILGDTVLGVHSSFLQNGDAVARQLDASLPTGAAVSARIDAFLDKNAPTRESQKKEIAKIVSQDKTL